MPRPASYVVGVSCAGVGTTLISILLDAQQATISAWLILIAFVAVFAPGGLLITAAWWLRASGVMPADKLSRSGLVRF